ncbi:MAG: GAF and ANTAR domain-containing protein [Actinobacteria bacterium]|nr:GAF and ANTAR domain-containing protein [Actinomycetota bacterium]
MTGLLAVDGAGVMVEDAQGDLRFLAASDDHIGEIEQLQVETGEGPCVTAHATGQAVTIDDLTAVDWLPRFAPRALDHGMHAVYSFPMRVDDTKVGALNLYRFEPGRFADDVEHAAQLLADLGTSYILSVDAAQRTTRLASQLQHALDSRVVIEQAKGKLSGEWSVTTSEAFERMRRYARNHQRRLHDVATDIVDGRMHARQLTADESGQPAGDALP